MGERLQSRAAGTGGAATALLIDADATEAARIREALAGARDAAGDGAFELECADRVSTGLARLAEGGIDVVLLALSLPDGSGLETLDRLREHGPDVPIVVLAGAADEAVGLEAVRAGAQDCLVKHAITPASVLRALTFARERHRMQAALKAMALLDPLTGLHNRRGYMALAEQALKVATRAKRPLLVVLGDVDGLKAVNDAHGHQAGDRAILEAASALRASLRHSDLIARLGGDEFAVVAVDAAPAVAELLIARVGARLAEASRSRNLPSAVSMTMGAAAFDPDAPTPLEQLMALADDAVYVRKRLREHAGGAPEGVDRR